MGIRVGNSLSRVQTERIARPRCLGLEEIEFVDRNGDTNKYLHMTNGVVDAMLGIGPLKSTWGMDGYAGCLGKYINMLTWEAYSYRGPYSAGEARVISNQHGCYTRDKYAANKYYAVGDLVVASADNADWIYRCMTAGVSTAEPNWPTSYGGTVTANGNKWTCIGKRSKALAQHREGNRAVLVTGYRLYKSEADAIAGGGAGTSTLNPRMLGPDIDSMVLAIQKRHMAFEPLSEQYPAIQIGIETSPGASTPYSGEGKWVGYRRTANNADYGAAVPPDTVRIGWHCGSGLAPDDPWPNGTGQMQVGMVFDWPYDNPMHQDPAVSNVNLKVYIAGKQGDAPDLRLTIFPWGANGGAYGKTHDWSAATVNYTAPGWYTLSLPAYKIRKGTNIIFITGANKGSANYYLLGLDRTNITTKLELKNYAIYGSYYHETGKELLITEFYQMWRNRDAIRHWIMLEQVANQDVVKPYFLGGTLGDSVHWPQDWSNRDGLNIGGADYPPNAGIKRAARPNEVTTVKHGLKRATDTGWTAEPECTQTLADIFANLDNDERYIIYSRDGKYRVKFLFDPEEAADNRVAFGINGLGSMTDPIASPLDGNLFVKAPQSTVSGVHAKNSPTLTLSSNDTAGATGTVVVVTADSKQLVLDYTAKNGAVLTLAEPLPEALAGGEYVAWGEFGLYYNDSPNVELANVLTAGKRTPWIEIDYSKTVADLIGA
jgi:hypothetical protein